MSDIYKIAVKLTMESNAAAVLGTLSRQVLGVHADVKKLEGGLASLNRVKLAVFGGIGIAAGTGFLAGLKALTDQAADLSHELAGIATFKINPAAGAALVAQADAVARATTRGVLGTTEAGNVKLFAETYSMFGAANAARINAPLAKFGRVLGDIEGDPDRAQEQLYALVKAGDLMGKLIDEQTKLIDTDKLQAFLDVAVKVAAATRGKVGPDQFYQMAQQGGPALATMSDDGLMSMAMVAQGMGGFRAGTALTGLFQQFVGGKMTEPVAEALKDLGLIGDFTTGRGGHLTFGKGALDTPFAKAIMKDPTQGVDLLMRAMAEHGMTSLESQTKQLFKILGRQTTQRLVSDFARNLPQMLSERGRVKDTQGVDRQYETRNAQDYITNEHNLADAWTNLMQAVAGPQAKMAIGVMQQATGALNALTEAVRGMNPDTLAAVGRAIGGVGVVLTGAGATALIAAMGPAGWLVAGIGGLAAAIAAFKPEALKELAGGLVTAWDGILHFDWHKIAAGVGQEFAGAFHTLPDIVHDSIVSAISGIGHLVADEFHKLLGAIGGVLSHISYDGAALGGGSLIRASYVTGSGSGGFGGRLAEDIITGAGGAGFNVRGVRNMNPGNIGWGAWARAHGAVGGAGSDTGHLVAVFPSFEAGYAAMSALAGDKYRGGRRSIDSLIAGANGWTAGNHAAAANVARMMGISPFADAHLDSPAMMRKFQDALSVQELGPAGAKAARRGMHAPPPPAKGITAHITVPVHVDGKQIAKVVTKHQVEAMTMPNGIGAHDSYSSYAAAGAPMFAA